MSDSRDTLCFWANSPIRIFISPFTKGKKEKEYTSLQKVDLDQYYGE